MIAHRVNSARDSVPYEQVVALTDSNSLQNAGFTCMRLNRFLRKRSQVVIRNLLPQTDYVVSIIAANDLAHSAPCIVFFRTAEASADGGFVSRCSVSRRIAGILGKLFIWCCKVLLMLYVLLTLYILWVNHEKFRHEVCQVTEYVRLKHLTELTCSRLIPSPPVPSPSPAATVYDDDVTWWFGLF